jgi:hypothetical protein
MSRTNEYFNEGRDAYTQGSKVSDNPYTEYTEEYIQWKKGFKQGEKESKE